MTTEQKFEEFVRRVLNAWSGYQLALDNSCGGEETKEKAEWIVNVIVEHVVTSRGLKSEDFEDWLTNILYHDFDLILEDDSVYSTCFLLLEAFTYIKNDNQAGINQLLSGLPNDEELAKIKKQSVRGQEDDEMDIDDVPQEDMEEAGPSDEHERKPRIVKEVDEDGWTTIVRR
ncbi:unnamed protein product [Caenorhabditis bovis]|uniref:Pre-rRNA-processing protein TSR2 homolog n=1 Tax=Caenorhabditis bovis TaxID=2654633 RepID=A0A8S1FAE5_9PELO|nr:unnamed protein product [Caenorhabditis bovis]